jgi:site-specific DNA recombinase
LDEKQVKEVLESGKLAVYKRVSTNEQDPNKRQNEVIDRFLQNKGISSEGLDVFLDPDDSAYNKPHHLRKNFTKLLDAAKAKEIDGVIVSDISRISRQTKEHFELRRLFESLGIPVFVAVNGDLYGKPDSKDLIKHLIEDGLTKMESDNNSVRTRDTLESLRNEGKFTGGKIPYGYEAKKEVVRKYVTDGRVEEELKVNGVKPIRQQINTIKYIYKLYQGSGTFKSISKTLEKIKPLEKWSAKKVKYIITNPFYTGHFVYYRKLGNYSFAPLADWVWKPCPWIKDPPITKEQWLYCWNKFQQSKNENPYYFHTSFAFQGIITCSCGEKMKGVDQRTKSKTNPDEKDGYRYYKCNCGTKVTADKLHDKFIGFYEGLPLPMDTLTTEVYQRMIDEIEPLRESVSIGEENLKKFNKELQEILSKLPQDEQLKKKVLLKESDDSMYLALLIAKKKLDEKISLIRGQLDEEKRYLKAFENFMQNHMQFKAMLHESLQKIKWEKQLLRSLVLMMVKECNVTTDNGVSFSFYFMPNKIFSPIS